MIETTKVETTIWKIVELLQKPGAVHLEINDSPAAVFFGATKEEAEARLRLFLSAYETASALTECTEELQYWPVNKPLPDGWEMVPQSASHHSAHGIIIRRVRFDDDATRAAR